MTRKKKRGLLIGAVLSVLALAGGLVLFALQDSIVFFHSPSDIAEKGIKPGQRFRLGGLVEKGSVVRGEGLKVSFAITDGASIQKVSFDKILPDLFREEQGVIAEGQLSPSGIFVADSVLAKHDETYMPPEVAAALKKRGVWQGDGTKAKGAAE